MAEPPIEDVLDEFVPEWRDGVLSPSEAVDLFRERAAAEMDRLLDLYNELDPTKEEDDGREDSHGD